MYVFFFILCGFFLHVFIWGGGEVYICSSNDNQVHYNDIKVSDTGSAHFGWLLVDWCFTLAIFQLYRVFGVQMKQVILYVDTYKDNNKITELRTILQRESQNS